LKKLPFRQGFYTMYGEFEYHREPVTVLATNKPHVLKQITTDSQVWICILKGVRGFIDFSNCPQVFTMMNYIHPFQQGLFIDVNGNVWMLPYVGEKKCVGEYRKGMVDVEIPDEEKVKCPFCGSVIDIVNTTTRLSFELRKLTQIVTKRCSVCGREFQTVDPTESFCHERCERWFLSIPESDNLYPYWVRNPPPKPTYDDE